MEKRKVATAGTTTTKTNAKIQNNSESTNYCSLIDEEKSNPITKAGLELDMLCNDAAKANEIPYFDVWSNEENKVEFLFKHGDSGVLARSNLHLIKGKRGSRKTFLAMEMILAAMGKSEIFTNNSDKPIKVLWADTEQDATTIRERAQTAFKARNITPDHPIRTLHLRPYDNEQRRQYLFKAIDDFHPDLVVIDIASDTMNFKPGDEGSISKEEVQLFSQKAENEKCAIVGVMHMNKSADDTNASGHKGTAWEAKSAECYIMDKTKDCIYNDKRRFGKDLEPIKFAIKNDWTMTSDVTSNEENKKRELTKMVKKIMKQNVEYRANELEKKVSDYTNCKKRQASNIIRECVVTGIIDREQISKNNVIYKLHTDNRTQSQCS